MFKIIFTVLTLGIFWQPSLTHIYEHINTIEDVEYYLSYFEYSKDRETVDKWKSPEQFISDGGGDCEDFAIMSYEMLLRLNYKPKIYGMWNSDDERNAHAICVFEEGLFDNDIYKKLTLFEYMIYNNYTDYKQYNWERRRFFIVFGGDG